jgi:hypothetical protein
MKLCPSGLDVFEKVLGESRQAVPGRPAIYIERKNGWLGPAFRLFSISSLVSFSRRRQLFKKITYSYQFRPFNLYSLITFTCKSGIFNERHSRLSGYLNPYRSITFIIYYINLC